MTCQAIRQLVPLFVEGDLPRRKADGVSRHLDGCATCRGLAEEYRQSQRWLRAAPGPTPDGDALDELRRSVWRRIGDEPRPAPWWLAIERGWAALRRWASQPAVAGMAVMLVVIGSVTFTRVGGLHRSPLVESGLSVDPAGERQLEQAAGELAGETPDDPENMLAQVGPEEPSDGTELGDLEGAGAPSDGDAMRIELQTRDPNVRIIWFTPPADTPAVEN